ncbi:hypothetical protein CCMSSC00406_0008616 [Pleurotus cornucopiae]|uniref:Uncharacterized protein n=1 Tax=Pleurotus cornucopiae TaxID=5321 RepID=A0ACB7IIA3_PLECO|nr:hypothetical protein CCMSSC00406_0008616 [Pleurotus cornucopiae]
MLSRGLLVFLSVCITVIGVNAANDWSKPCFDGECAYDMLPSTGGSGIIKLFGSPKSLTDITPAAGWVILDCDPNVVDQEIRLVCESDDEDSGCQHIFDHHGPIDKIVRLPESCSSGPFARIASMMVAEDQSLPTHAQSKIRRRDGAAAEVHVVRIDSNFASVDPEKMGEVKFAFVGATVPGLDLNAAFDDGFFDVFKSIGNWVSHAANTVATAVSDAANTVATAVSTAAKSVASWAGKAYKDVSDLVGKLNHFEITPQVESSVISLNTNGTLTFETPPPTCPSGAHTTVSAKVESTGSIQVKAGIVIVGNIFPPKIEEFAAFGGINGTVDAKLQVDLEFSGGFRYQKKLITDMGLPGLSLPPLITIGPYVTLDAIAQGHLELAVKADVHLAYEFKDLEMWYPKEHKKLAVEKGIKSKDSDLSLQASAHLNAKGFVQGTLAPQIHLGVSAIGGAVSASLWVGADAWVRASVVAEADASVSAGAAPGKKAGNAVAPAKAATPGHAAAAGKHDRKKATRSTLQYVPPYSHQQRHLVGRNSVGFSGCLWIDAGLHLKGGATGNILSWSAGAELSIWESPAWELFHKCWAVGSAKDLKVSKPTYTMAQVDALSKNKQECSAHLDLSTPISDRVAGKSLQK